MLVSRHDDNDVDTPSENDPMSSILILAVALVMAFGVLWHDRPPGRRSR